jgi:hypothetical protein
MARKKKPKPRKAAAPADELPPPESVESERQFVSPKGTRFRILRSREVDPGEDKQGHRPDPAQGNR